MDVYQHPRDGDIILSKDHFIFYVFGYDHPADKVVAYLKYIPKEIKGSFNLTWIPFEWNLSDLRFIRPKQLYSPQIFKEITKTFKEKYADYLYQDPYIGKVVFVVPKNLIERVFIPEAQWKLLQQKIDPDPLEKEAINLIQMLSEQSKVKISDFGIHGSISTGMHTENSDIDIAVYGAGNFLTVKKTVFRLFKEKKLEYLNETESDECRMNKALYEGRKFVFNAIRNVRELQNNYGRFKFTAVRPLHFHCDVVLSLERMFRPAIYNVEEYFPVDTDSILVESYWPKQVVAMIGEFRDVARKGDEVEVKGMLEKVEDLSSKEEFYRVVIGSGKDEEFIWPI